MSHKNMLKADIADNSDKSFYNLEAVDFNTLKRKNTYNLVVLKDSSKCDTIKDLEKRLREIAYLRQENQNFQLDGIFGDICRFTKDIVKEHYYNAHPNKWFNKNQYSIEVLYYHFIFAEN